MTIFTDAVKAEYLKSGGSICPFCGGKDIEGGNTEADGTSVWIEILCENCGSRWHDIYTLTDIEEIVE